MTVKFDQQRASKALEFLSETPYFPHRVRAIRSHTQKKRENPFDGELDFLNELVNIGLKDRLAMEKLIEQAKQKRGGDSFEKRRAYQLEFMRNKRFRETLFLKTLEITAGKKLALETRKQALKVQHQLWVADKEDYVRNRARGHGVKTAELSFSLKGQFIRDYWVLVQNELLDRLRILAPEQANKLLQKHLRKQRSDEMQCAELSN